MELTCAIVLVLGSLVTATPHGYGTKGGASAKAEASAVAGSFGGLGRGPIDIPNGAGYSGSYSKSSSSSFSSASASSSSSSSSFSYNGAGAGGFPGSAPYGSTAPSAGCGSGGCQLDGSKGLGTQGSSGTVAGIESYSGANAAATAGAGASAGCGTNGCHFGGANGVTGSHVYSGAGAGSQANSHLNSAVQAGAECGSSGCGSKDITNTGGQQVNSNANYAASAGAGPLTGLSKYPSNVGLNQPSACEGYNCNNPPGTENKCTSGQCDKKSEPTDKCVSGQCGTAPQSEAPLSDYGPNDIQVTGTGISGLKSSYDTKINANSNYDKISSTNIGLRSDCSYGNCEPAGSSYSKPLYPHGLSNTYQGTSPSSQNHQPTKCDSPNCNTYGYDSSSVSGNVNVPAYNTPSTHLTTPKQVSACTTSNCQSESGGTQPSSFVPLDTYESSQSGSKKNPSCSSGNCDTNHPSLPTSYLSPPYEPVNCAGESCTGSPSTQANINHSGSPSSKRPSCAPGTLNCDSPHPPTSAGLSPPGSRLPSYNAPSAGFPSSQFNAGSGASGSRLPSYSAPSAGFPTSQPGAIAHAPLFRQPSYPRPSGGFPLGQAGAESHVPGSGLHSYNVPPAGFASVSHTSGSGLSSYYTPSTGFPSSKPSTGTHAPESGLNSYDSPLGGSPVTSCKTPNCADQTFDTKPISSSSQKLPAYTGGFGGPSGILNPNEHSVPASNYNNKPTTPSGIYDTMNNPTFCSSGNCGSKPGHISPAYTVSGTANGAQATADSTSSALNVVGSHYTPSAGGTLSGCKTPDCADQTPGAGTQPGSFGITKPSDGSSSNSQKHPAYTGGFGGPAGILKPNQHSVPLSSFNHNPMTASGTVSPTSCTSGSCESSAGHTPSHVLGSTTSGAQATASAEANANAVAYNGGFGGPPGLLKPYDSGKLGTSAPTGKQLSSEFDSHQATAPGATSTFDTHVGSGSHVGAGAQASAVALASATAGANSGGFGSGALGDKHGNGFKLTGGCGGGCGSNGSYNDGANGDFDSKPGFLNGFNSGLPTPGANAKSQAGAVSGAGVFGLGGSYASSSATAQASSGAAVKGGYGRR